VVFRTIGILLRFLRFLRFFAVLRTFSRTMVKKSVDVVEDCTYDRFYQVKVCTRRDHLATSSMLSAAYRMISTISVILNLTKIVKEYCK